MPPEIALKPPQGSANEWQGLPIESVDHSAQLSDALKSDADAAIWNRSLPMAVESWLDALPADRLPEGRFVLKPADVSPCMAGLFAASRHEASPALTWLCEDAAHLADHVCEIAGATLVRLRVEPVFDNACSKLHIDNVVARLICTYRGPGTQVGLADAASETIKNIATGMPILLKGKRWPGAHDPKLRHRSPPIEGTGRSRLVLVLEGVSPEGILPGYDTLYPSAETPPSASLIPDPD